MTSIGAAVAITKVLMVTSHVAAVAIIRVPITAAVTIAAHQRIDIHHPTTPRNIIHRRIQNLIPRPTQNIIPRQIRNIIPRPIQNTVPRSIIAAASIRLISTDLKKASITPVTM